jgi:glucose 1-dehydrogenase
MRAITVVPGQAGSARLDDVPEPDAAAGSVLVDGLALGICGTDAEIAGGEYGWAPGGERRLVLGHESLGRVRECPEDAGLAPGDLVVGIVRRPDPEPCACCARGEWDFCRNGRYTERGIKERHGYGSERWRVEPEFAVRVDPGLEDVGVLLEPASVLAKAWEQIDRIGARACFDARRVLVTGAGPIGLLGALLAVQRGYEVHVLDRVTEGRKPDLVRRLGATYHSGDVKDAGEIDVVVEATGAGPVVVDAMAGTARNGIVCLTGVSPAGRRLELDVGGLNRSLVLENDVVFGSVNANRRHYEAAG